MYKLDTRGRNKKLPGNDTETLMVVNILPAM
jgi:hypothetical protein